MLFDRVTLQLKIEFIQNLAVMLRAGIPLDEALANIAEETRSKRFRSIVEGIRSDVETGRKLSRALGRHERVFGEVFVSFVRAGEASGTLEENLAFLADWLEKDRDLKKDVAAVTFYPKLVLGATVLLGGGLAVFILPRLVPLFGQLDVELPFSTKILLATTLFIEKFWLAAIAVLVLGVVGFMLLYRLRGVRAFFHAAYLKVPFLKDFIEEYQLALIFQLMNVLFRSGLAVNELLAVIASSATNLRYRDSLARVEKRVAMGAPLSAAFRDFPGLYPRNAIYIIAAGEASGALEESFGHIAGYYNKKVRRRVKMLPVIMEPVLLISIGVIVGFIALSIISPIYELTSGLDR